MKKAELRNKFLGTIWEVIMIVVGILIAIAIDDWNSDRLVQKDKRSLLQNLSVELEDNRNKIIQKQWEVRKTFKCLLTIIQHSGPVEKAIEDSTLMKFIHSSLGDLNIDFSDAALLDIVNSGQLQLIDLDSARILISTWEAAIQHRLLREEDSRNRLLTYLSRTISFVDMDRNNAYLKKSGMVANSDFKIENKAILRDHEYQNLCEDHLWHVREVMLYYEKLLVLIRDLHTNINKELN